MVHENGNIDIRSSAAAQIKYGQGGPGAPEVAWQEDRYICKGDGIEVFEPKFTFHGFRYVEITGLPYQPSLNDLEGLRLNTDLVDQSEFYCSNPLFNKIQEITEWAMLSNVFSVQSDCPAREKYGYGGDMVAVGEAYIYNYDMANFYTKTVRDFARDALPDGGMTECAPNIGVNARGVTEESGPVGWTLAHPFLLQKVYKYYGDLNLVKEQYDPLKDLVNFYHRNVPDHIIMVGIGDHKCVDQRPTPVSSTAFYYHHVKILAKMAGLLDKKKDQEFYADLAEKIKAAFIKAVGQHAKKTHSYVKTRFFDLLNNGLNLKNIINLRIVELNKVILYRITHIENISHILQHGITHRDSINKNPFYKNIGDLSLIDTRSKRKANIDNGALNPNNDMVTITLGDFIPFYFGVKMPMLYVAQHGGNFVERPTSPADIVYLGCSLSKIISSQLNFYFSDGHATDVLTSFYDNSKIIELVNIVDWEAVKSSYWGGAENLNIKRKKQAEFLVSGDLSPDFIIAFGCFNENAKDKLISLGVVSDKIKIIPQAYY